MDLRVERGTATRQLLLAGATQLFAERGFDDVSIELVLKQTKVSKGALYHHFSSKDALFVAVLEEVESRIVATVSAAAQHAQNPLDALRAGCGAWLELVAGDAVVRRIAVIDAPSVLGWQAWRELEGRYALGLLRSVLRMAANAGCFPLSHVDVYASMLLAVLNEMAMRLARAEDRGLATSTAKDAIELAISSVIGVEAYGPWLRTQGSCATKEEPGKSRV